MDYMVKKHGKMIKHFRTRFLALRLETETEN